MQRQSVTARWAKSRHTPDPLFVALGRRAVAACVVVAELNALVHVVADRLYALPAAGGWPEQRPSEIGQPLGVAIAASIEERQNLVGQVIDVPLAGLGSRFIREATVFNQKVVADFDAARGRHKPCPGIAKWIEALAGDDPWRQLNLVLTAQVFLA